MKSNGDLISVYCLKMYMWRPLFLMLWFHLPATWTWEWEYCLNGCFLILDLWVKYTTHVWRLHEFSGEFIKILSLLNLVPLSFSFAGISFCGEGLSYSRWQLFQWRKLQPASQDVPSVRGRERQHETRPWGPQSVCKRRVSPAV